MHRYDVIVVGGGLAGLRAGRDLADRGRSVVVLEARERVGGRGYTKALAGRRVEVGGSWFTPEQTQVRAELDRYGLPIRDFVPVEHARWFTSGELRLGLPVPWQDLADLERVLTRITQDAAADREIEGSVAALSAAEYLANLRPTPAVRDFLLGWWQITGGAAPESGAVIDALSAIAGHGGLTGLLTCLAHAPSDGWTALADSLARSPGVEVRLGTPVTRVVHDDAATTAHLGDGTSVEGRAIVVAVPLNCLGDIDFVPQLPDRVSASFGANAGRAIKVVMLAGGVPPHGLAVGMADGFKWLYVDEVIDDLTTVIGFSWPTASFDPDSGDDVAASLHQYFPDARVVEHIRHDWIGDPWSKGTWLTAHPGAVDLLEPGRFSAVDGVWFAGSDVAHEHAGWFEGALRSGAAVAEQISVALDR